MQKHKSDSYSGKANAEDQTCGKKLPLNPKISSPGRNLLHGASITVRFKSSKLNSTSESKPKEK